MATPGPETDDANSGGAQELSNHETVTGSGAHRSRHEKVDLRGLGRHPESLHDHGNPPVAIVRTEGDHVNREGCQEIFDDSFDLELKTGAHCARPIVGWEADHRNLEQNVVRPDPFRDERIEIRLAAGARHEVSIVVQHRPVADDDLIRCRRLELLSDLSMENPRLRVRRGVLVDRKRTSAGYLFHDVDSKVEALELGRQVEAERGLADAMRAYKGDFQPAAAERVERQKLSRCSHRRKECSARPL